MQLNDKVRNENSLKDPGFTPKPGKLLNQKKPLEKRINYWRKNGYSIGPDVPLMAEQEWGLDTQRNGTQNNDTQHNDIQHKDIQHNDIQHGDMQHNNE